MGHRAASPMCRQPAYPAARVNQDHFFNGTVRSSLEPMRYANSPRYATVQTPRRITTPKDDAPSSLPRPPHHTAATTIPGVRRTGGGTSTGVGRGEGKRAPGPPVGLVNLGNTCFMNATLQCLLNNPSFVDRVAGFAKGRTDGGLQGELTAAFEDFTAEVARLRLASGSASFYTGGGASAVAVSPSGLKRAVGKWRPFFGGYRQHDAQEFLRFIIDGLHEEQNKVPNKHHYEELKDVAGESFVSASNRWWAYAKKRDDSSIHDCFSGQLISCRRCDACGNHSLAFDPFLDLSTPLPRLRSNRTTLHDCLGAFTERVVWDGGERVQCATCKKPTRSARYLKIFRLPNTLVVHLMRFSSESYMKRADDVQIPEVLDMAEYVDAQARGLPENAGTTYVLDGVVHHTGSTAAGHYTATVKHNGEWYDCNDSSVHPLRRRSINLAGSSPYILFYTRAPPSNGYAVL
ncbi:Ubiquitin carboxyl-terminal hydrolase 4 [Diplonema papillatum]|nr:Ubiquitin carboxyl-terminal hydrolase 4 [Diplonema papillatum]